MKIFLIVPRSANPKQTYREYPLGVGLIATALGQRGCEVTVYDQNAEGPDDQRLFTRLREERPGIVGFSVITPNYPFAKAQIQQVKRELPETFIVAGGIHASLFPEDLLDDGAEAIVVGEGVGVVSELIEKLKGGQSWEGLPGVAFRDESGRAVLTVKPAQCLSADDLPLVDRDVFNLPLYTHHSMMASLGCPHRCTFCCNYSGTVLQDGVTIRTPDSLCREMRYLASRYGAKQVFFADDVFLISRGNVLGFCRRLNEEHLDMQWVAQMRVDAVDPEVASAMREAGCGRIYFGVESGSDAMLRRVCKGIDRMAIRRGVSSAKQAGMRVKTGWVFGLPGTLEEQYESVALMCELRPHEISIHQFIPFPGTMYYERPSEHGIRFRNPKDFASFCYGGLSDNISFDYLARSQLEELLEYTAGVLEAEGYVNSDRATGSEEYVFSTPLNAQSMSVFHSTG